MASMLIAVTTSMLVFIGGVELQRAAAHNNDISQTIWCWIYFVIAFASFHGGLVVLTPAVNPNNVNELNALSALSEPQFNTTQINKGNVKASACEKRINLLGFLKTEFVDSNGKYFPLKLALTEMFEFVLQLQSLLSSASSSDAELVLISAIVIAINLIALPIAILIALKCNQEPHFVLAIILSVGKFLDSGSLWVNTDKLNVFSFILKRNIV